MPLSIMNLSILWVAINEEEKNITYYRPITLLAVARLLWDQSKLCRVPLMGVIQAVWCASYERPCHSGERPAGFWATFQALSNTGLSRYHHHRHHPHNFCCRRFKAVAIIISAICLVMRRVDLGMTTKPNLIITLHIIVHHNHRHPLQTRPWPAFLTLWSIRPLWRSDVRDLSDLGLTQLHKSGPLVRSS